MFLSSVHQHSDARQRKTMVETYIALEAEGKLTDEQRTMITEAMFRPVTTGVVKKDETPSHPFGFISKIIGRDWRRIQKAARGYANMNQLNTGIGLLVTTLTTAGFWGTVPVCLAGGTYTPKTVVPSQGVADVTSALPVTHRRRQI
jgi:hypothetical protein